MKYILYTYILSLVLFTYSKVKYHLRSNVYNPYPNYLAILSGYVGVYFILYNLLLPFDDNPRFKIGSRWVNTSDRSLIEITQTIGYTVHYRVIKSKNTNLQLTGQFTVYSYAPENLVKYTKLTGLIYGL